MKKNEGPMNITRIAVMLLCLWGALDAATLKRGVKGSPYESYYCLPIDTMSEVFSEKYRKNFGEYDHLAIRFDQSWGNPIAFFRAVSEALGENTTWQREGFFLVFDTEEPIESIEHREGKYKYPGELEMVIPVRQQPIPKEQLVLYETLPNEYLTVTEGISFNHIKEFWESSISWSLVEAGLSKSRKQQEIVALLDHQGHPLSKEWSEAYLKKPDKTPGIGLLIRLEGELFIDGKVKYSKAHLVVRHDMSPILRLSGLSTSIFTYGGFVCWEGRYIPDYCKNKPCTSIFGYDASDLMVTMKRKAEDIRFIKKPNPLEWEDDPEFAGIDAQIRILKKEELVQKKTFGDLLPYIFLLLLPLGLITIYFFIYILHIQPETRKRWVPVFKAVAYCFLGMILSIFTGAPEFFGLIAFLTLSFSSMVLVLFGVRGLMERFPGKKGVFLSLLNSLGGFGSCYLLIFVINSIIPMGESGGALIFLLYGSAVSFIPGLAYTIFLHVKRKVQAKDSPGMLISVAHNVFLYIKRKMQSWEDGE
jgi:hypothetical protein